MRSFLNENKIVRIVIAISLLTLLSCIIVIFFNVGTDKIILTNSGISYNEIGSVNFVANDEYYTKNGGSSSYVENKELKNGAPLIYDDETVLLTEPAIIAFSDKKELVDTNSYTEIIKDNGVYSITNDQGEELAKTQSMMIKTISDYYIYLGQEIEFESKGELIKSNDYIVTKLNDDDTITLFDTKNINYISSDVVLKSKDSTFNFSTLEFIGENTTDFSKLEFGDGDIKIKSNISQKSKNNEENSDSFTDQNLNDQESESNQNISNDTSLEGNKNESENNVNGFFEFYNDAKSYIPPKINATLSSDDNSITVLTSVYDPSHTLTDKINIELYEGNDIVSFKSVDVEEQVVKFDNLKSDTLYNLKISSEYINEHNKIQSTVFYASSIKTTKFGIDLKVISQSSNTVILNAKIGKNQNIDSANLDLYKLGNDANEYISTFKINVDEASSDEGQNILIEGLESNTNYLVEVNDVFVNGVLQEVYQTLITQTLKVAPEVSVPNVSINIMDAYFSVISQQIIDPDSSILSIEYQMYEDSSDGLVYVQSMTKEKGNLNSNADFYVDDNLVNRNVNYRFKGVIKGNNNKNNFEINTDYSIPIQINTLTPPSAEISNITSSPSTISAMVNIYDPDNTIIGNLKYKVLLGSVVVSEGNLTTGKDEVFNVEELLNNTTYDINIYADFDLGSSNVFESEVIGTAEVQTKDYTEQQVKLVSVDPYCTNSDINCVLDTSANLEFEFITDDYYLIQEATLVVKKGVDVVKTIPLTSNEITSIHDNKKFSLDVDNLLSNTEYTVELIDVSDGKNIIPTKTINAKFATKKSAPEYLDFELFYNEEDETLELYGDDVVDIDNSFDTYIYNLYTSNSSGEVEELVNTYSENNLNDTYLNIPIDNTIVKKNNYFTIEVLIKYDNGYYIDQNSMGFSNVVVVDKDIPTVDVINANITDNSITFDIIIKDDDHAIINDYVNLELFTGEYVNQSINVPTNELVSIEFDGLISNTNYTLIIDSDLDNIENYKDFNILTYDFTTKVSTSGIPKFLDSYITKDEGTLDILYDYSVKDMNDLIIGITIDMNLSDKDEIIYSYNTNTKTDSNARFAYNIPEIIKNEDYEIGPVIHYLNNNFVEINDDMKHVIMDETGTYVTANDASIIADNKPSYDSIFTLEPKGDGYYIKTDENYLILNAYGELELVSDRNKATEFLFEQDSQYYYIKSSTGNYLTKTDASSSEYLVTTDKTQAIRFKLFLEETIIGPVTDINIESAQLPYYSENSFDSTSNNLILDYNIIDKSKIANSVVSYSLIELDSNTEVDNGTILPNTPTKVQFNNLKYYTEYKLQFEVMINKQEMGSDNEKYSFYSPSYRTISRDEEILEVNAVFDQPNRNIILKVDAIDDRNILEKYKVDIYDKSDKFVATISGEYVNGEDIIIDFTSSDLVDVHINEEYSFDVELSDIDDSVIINKKTNLTNLDYVTASAIFYNILSNEEGIKGDVKVLDDDNTIVDSIELELREITDEATGSYDVINNQDLLVGNSQFDFADVKEYTHYNIVVTTNVDTNGKGLIEEIEIGIEDMYSYEIIPDVLGTTLFFNNLNDLKTFPIAKPGGEDKISEVNIEVYSFETNELVFKSELQEYSNTNNDFVVSGLVPDTIYIVNTYYHYQLYDGTTGIIKNSTYTVTPIVVEAMQEMHINIVDENTLYSETPVDIVFKDDNEEIILSLEDVIDKIKLPYNADTIIINDGTTGIVIDDLSLSLDDSSDEDKEKNPELITMYETKKDSKYSFTCSNDDANLIVTKKDRTLIERILGKEVQKYSGDEIDKVFIDAEKIDNYTITCENGGD